MKLKDCSAPSAANEVACLRQSSKLPIETLEGRPRPTSSPTAMSRSGSGYGKGRSTTACTTLKIAVVAPMPRAMVSAATRAKPGALTSCRSA